MSPHDLHTDDVSLVFLFVVAAALVAVLASLGGFVS